MEHEGKKRVDYSFDDQLKKGVYDAIYKRRDIRQFLSDPIPEEILIKILEAGHQAGSVGLMQPWNFIVINDPRIKSEVKKSFLKSSIDAAALYSDDKLKLYQQLKLEGIEEAPINIGVTCDYSRKGPHVLGTRTMPRTPLFSACCAIQNIWLAARAEGIGMGWVSILDPKEVKESLKIPASIELVAYLCLGYVEVFPGRPVLEEAGWEGKEPFEKFLSWNQWDSKI